MQALLEQLAHDLRYGLRQLRKRPAFTIAAVGTLALGIGANTAIFSLIDAALLDDPPYAAPDRLVAVTHSLPAIGEARFGVSVPEYIDYRDRTHAFSSVAGYSHVVFDMTAVGEAERVEAVQTTASLFETLGVAPLVGRTLLQTDESNGAPRVAVLSFEFWRRRYDQNPAVLGTSITLNERPHTVVGVMPRGFEFPSGRTTIGEPPAMWVALSFTPRQLAARAVNADTHIVARLAPAVTLAQARSDVSRVADEFQREHPDIYSGRVRVRAAANPFSADAAGKVRPVLLMLAGTVALVLVTACANVANLLLVRASARQKEMAVRRALGASRTRIVRQLLTESLLLASLGGLLGCALAALLTSTAAVLLPDQIVSLRDVRIDGTVLAFTAGLSMLTGVLCGLAPAVDFGAGNAAETLKQAGRQIGDSRRSRRLRDGIVIFEVASAVVLLVGAGLLLHSFVNVIRTPLGFNPDDVLVVRTSFNRQRYPDAERRHAAERQIAERLAALPAARVVGLTTHVPLADDRTIGYALDREGADQVHWAANALVSSEYFEAMGIPLVRGRNFTADDRADTPMVAIVNETLARRHWRDRDPIGEYLLWGGRRLRVVGVAGDVHVSGLDADVEPTVYCPVYQIESGATTSAVFVLRTAAGGGTQIASAARAAIQSVDPALPVFDLRPMHDIVRRSLASRRAIVTLLVTFAGVGLVLAIGGLYAVLSHAVARRTQELGVRVALGAKSSDIVTMVVGEGLRLVVVGLVLGAAAALAVAGTISSLLFGVGRRDPVSFAAAAILLLIVSLLASYRVGRRAARVDPIAALRAE